MRTFFRFTDRDALSYIGSASIVLIALVALLAAEPSAAATIIVNSTDDPGTPGDDYVTLREAIQFATEKASPSGGEIAQVTGTPGAASADTIRFDPNVFPPEAPATIFVVESGLPALDTGNDVIDGSDAGVVVDGSNAPEGTRGLVIHSGGNAIRYVTVQRFQLGIGILSGDGNTIGPGNTIILNASGGMDMFTKDNRIIGNYIGTDKDSTPGLGNNFVGVQINGPGNAGPAEPGNNVIGGSTPEERNIISGNQGSGVYIGWGAVGNTVIGNYIGTDVTGTVDLANSWHGVLISGGSRHNTIGDSDPGERNIISGNDEHGVEIDGADSNRVVGNYIGTDVTGMAALPNTGVGVTIEGGSFNVIGGETPQERNVISGNTFGGVWIIGGETDAAHNAILGNFIGTDVNGTTPLSNTRFGIEFHGSSVYNRIQGNVISANTSDGIHIHDTSSWNQIIGNFIGTDVSGTLDLGNSMGGISMYQEASHNLFQENTIAYNRETGIGISNSTAMGNTITRNSITANGGVGIDLSDGGNTELPAPVITTVTETEVSGTVDGSRVPDGSVVEIFNDPLDEGETFIGSITVGGGEFTFTGTIPTTGHITATVTDPDGNTSEFSYVDLPPRIVSTKPEDGGTRDRAKNIRAIFSEPMDESTLNTSTVLVSGTVSGVVTGNVWYEEGNAVFFDPDVYLTVGETVTVTITGEVQKDTGVGLDGNGDGVAEGSPTDDYTWSFTVVDVPPRVKQTFPSQDGIADPDIRITAAFDRAMDPGMLNASTFLVSGSESGTMAGTVTYDEGTRSATFFPGASFVEGETVTATITGEVQKDTGVGLDGNEDGVAEGSPTDDYTWSFVPTASVVCVAYPTETSPELDGEIGPGEYADTVPMAVNFDDPTTRPGIVPNWMTPPSDWEDLSYAVYAMYDEENLYIAVDVSDDVIIDDSDPGRPWEDDDVEVWLDGDEVANDLSINWSPNREGSAVEMDVGGDIWTGFGSYGTDWFGVVGTRPGGYVVEFRIPLTSIDMTDGEGESHPTSGSSIGFTVAVNDDDNGGNPYEQPDDSHGAWTGSYDNWYVGRESDWGILYFSETSAPVIVARIPEVVGMPGDTVRIPVEVASDVTGLDIISAQMEILYDGDLLIPIRRELRDTITDETWEMSSRIAYGVDGEMDTAKVAIASSNPLVGQGVLVWGVFEVSDAATLDECTPLVFERFMFNEGTPEAVTHDGRFCVGEPWLVGDVSGNEEVTAFDAAIILQFRVGLTDESEYPGLRPGVADVTRDGQVAALDASYILQYVVGSVPELPVPPEYLAKPVVAMRKMWLGAPERSSDGVRVPIWVDEVAGILSGEMVLSFDGSEEVEVDASDLTSEYLFASRASEGKVRVAFAGAEVGEGAGVLAYLRIGVPFDAFESDALRLDRVELNDGGIVVRVGERVDTSGGYRLAQNRPNPFNPNTTIQFELPTSGRVVLSVYNARGQLVRTLVSGFRNAGVYSVTWDGRDDVGRDVASGVYLCRMEAGSLVQTRKAVLIR